MKTNQSKDENICSTCGHNLREHIDDNGNVNRCYHTSIAGLYERGHNKDCSCSKFLPQVQDNHKGVYIESAYNISKGTPEGFRNWVKEEQDKVNALRGSDSPKEQTKLQKELTYSKKDEVAIVENIERPTEDKTAPADIKPIMKVFSKENFRQLEHKYAFTTSMVNDIVRNAKNMDVLVLQTQFREGRYWIDNAWVLNEESPEVFMELMFGNSPQFDIKKDASSLSDKHLGFNEISQGKTNTREMPDGKDNQYPADTQSLSDKILFGKMRRELIGLQLLNVEDVRLAVLRLKDEIENAQEDCANLDWISKEQVLEIINKIVGEGLLK